ncbi:MAG: BREX system serine/threonine kinase PglW [Kineosporiaceae bacterium]|nr:BREX system serine/threonine kinase PglW [Kineosporiaceae bacterium]
MVRDSRWVEVTQSQFAHEAEGLALVRAIMPEETPFRAWSNFEFRDARGRWYEVDLLLLGRDRLHLIELKHYRGVLRGDDYVWRREGHPPEDSPLLLARRKAQYLKSKLYDELKAWAAETKTRIPPQREALPYIQESVFLHAPDFTCELGEQAAINLYGPDGRERQSHLPGISALVLEPPSHRPIGPGQEKILTILMERIGVVRHPRRDAGSWLITGEAIASGDGWQDWPATHRVDQHDRARIRFQVLAPSATQQERAAVLRIATNEFGTMSRLQHDGLLRPRDLVESDLGVGLVYPDDPAWQRLDLWLSAQTNGVPLATQLSIIRQLGEALQYAHNNRVVHRALTPRAVRVRALTGMAHDVKVRIGDWQSAGRVTAEPGQTTPGPRSHTGVTSLAPDAPDDDEGMADVFLAPEGAWTPDADRVRLDVFGLGALAFSLLTGSPPAPSRGAFRERLKAQQGLDLAIELPQVSSTLRSLVLRATHPSPAQRTSDVTEFLAQLASAEREIAEGDVADPLEATTGTVLDGRFTLLRRLGQGSTAVGLLVRDALADGPDADRVLKVALDDHAATRLDEEAEVLRRLDSPRIVKLVEGPIVVGGRRALLLESAGAETLTDVMRTRTRLSLDLLERFGTELLDALVLLDRAGVDHRDIKPSNLGVREGRGDRTKHLVLFDFSLTRAAASATAAGTPPYLDPFLVGTRDRYDSAAERYAASVVLFEMATGRTPTYGDGQADPATITDEATVTADLFDPAIAADLTGFFTTALARDARQRHHTAEALRSAWLATFAGDATTQPDHAHDDLAARATLTTPLRDSGLTARALSALEPYGVSTVGELLTVDQVRISRMAGVANATRLQITSRVKQWRARLGDVAPTPLPGAVPTPTDAAELLLAAVVNPRSPSRAGITRLMLGLGTDLDAFATHAQLAAGLAEPVTGARATQLLGTLQELWAADDASRALLDRLEQAVSVRLTELGGVAAVAELTAAVVAALAPEQHPDPRLARGLLRLALDRRRAKHRADDDESPAVSVRRRGGQVSLLAVDQALFDVADTLAAEADRLVAALDASREVVAAGRVRDRLAAVMPPLPDVPAALAEPQRRATLAAATSAHAAASGAGELHHRDLSPVAALALTFADLGGQQLSPDEIRQRVRVRFPAVPELPLRPELDAAIAEAGLALTFDERTGLYRAPRTGPATEGLESRRPTSHALPSSPVGSTGALGARLEQSIASRSFLALGVRADRLDRFVEAAQRGYRAGVVDVTAVLLDALRAASAAAGLPWELVRAADAEAESSRGRRGLHELVRRSWPQVEAAIDAALAEDGGSGPVVVVEASPLARYDAMGLLARWTDLSASRARAVWLLVPQLGANQGAVLDGRPVPLAAPNQFVPLDTEWVDAAATAAAAREA